MGLAHEGRRLARSSLSFHQGAGLQLRWVKLGYAVDKASASQRHGKGYLATLAV